MAARSDSVETLKMTRDWLVMIGFVISWINQISDIRTSDPTITLSAMTTATTKTSLKPTTTANGFVMPAIWSFPPFFT